MKFRLLLLTIFIVLILTGCAAHYSPEAINDPYGFFSGVWHGAIAALTITVNIISWILAVIGIDFLRDIQVIGRPNTGFFYYFGFVIGVVWLRFV